MEDRHIILILLVIIVVLAAAIGVTLMGTNFAKEPSKVKITSEDNQFEGGILSVKLTDLNKTPISEENVNVTIENSKGKVVFDKVVKTNSKGKAVLELDLKKGKYTVNVVYGGNEKYTGNNTAQKLTITEEVRQADATTSSSGSSDPGAFFSKQSDEMIYTGDIKEGDDGHMWKHLGYNEWVRID